MTSSFEIQNMKPILDKAASMQKRAWRLIEETNIIPIWQEIGATINLVGSLKTGLLLNHRDIDFHIYTDPFALQGSFTAITRLAEDPHIKQITYTNLLEEQDRCLEWHAIYQDGENEPWQIDMIHILPDSPFVGFFEKVAARIEAVLTDETRNAILLIKDSLPHEKKVMGIQIYQAVIADGVRNHNEFNDWLDRHSANEIITWMP
jgi:hypothetical protein